MAKRRKSFRRFHSQTDWRTLRLELQDHVDSDRPLIAIGELVEWVGMIRYCPIVTNLGSDHETCDWLRHRWFDGDTSTDFEVSRGTPTEITRIRSDRIAPQSMHEVIVGTELGD